MHAFPGVDPQSVLDQTENLQHPLWFANKIHVVQRGKKFFTFSEEIARAWRDTLSLRCVLHFNLILPCVQRRLPVKPSHERQNTITCVHLLPKQCRTAASDRSENIPQRSAAHVRATVGVWSWLVLGGRDSAPQKIVELDYQFLHLFETFLFHPGGSSLWCSGCIALSLLVCSRKASFSCPTVSLSTLSGLHNSLMTRTRPLSSHRRCGEQLKCSGTSYLATWVFSRSRCSASDHDQHKMSRPPSWNPSSKGQHISCSPDSQSHTCMI